MGHGNRCFGCSHYEGEANGETSVYCSLNGRKEIRNGIIGCSSFSPDSSAACHDCHYRLGGPPGPICSKNITTMSSGFKFGFCHGFAKRNYYDESDLSSNKKKSGCFITEATCTHVGLPDDCDILVSLRNFRDQILLPSSEWNHLVYEYYDMAENMVADIDSSGKASHIYKEIFVKYLRDLSKVSDSYDAHLQRIELYKAMIQYIEEEIGS